MKERRRKRKRSSGSTSRQPKTRSDDGASSSSSATSCGELGAEKETADRLATTPETSLLQSPNKKQKRELSGQEELMKLRVWDLKAQLRALKQSTTGKKEQLVQRLLACQQADKSENEEEESEKQEQTEEKDEKVKENEEESAETKGAEKKVKEGNGRINEDKKDEERMEEEEENNQEERRKEQTYEETREKEATEDVAKKLGNAEEQQQEHTNDTQHHLEEKEERETKDEPTTSKKEANSHDPNGKDNTQALQHTPTRKKGVQGRLKKRVTEPVLIEDGEEPLEGSWLSCDKCDKWIYAPDDNIKDIWIYDDNNPNHEEYYCASCRRGGARAQNEQKVEEASTENTVNQEEVTERHGEASTRKDQLEVPPICLSLSPNVSPKDDTPSVFSSLNVRKKRRRRRSSYSTPRKKSSKTKRCSLSPSKEKEIEIETKGMKEQKQEATKGEEEERKESHENDVAEKAEDMENGADEENEEATIQVLPVSAEVLNKELSFVFMPTKPSAEELRGQQFRFRVGHATCKGGRNENQDAYIVPNKASVKRGDMPVFAVLDGHGIRGKPAAMESASIIASTIVSHYREKKRMSKPKKDQHQQQNSKVERAAQPSETSGLDDHLSSLANAGQRITRNKAKAAGCSTSAKNTTTINGQTSNEPTSSSSSSSSISSTFSNDPEEELRKCIQESLGAANQRLLQRMERSGEEYGTTCVLAVVMSSRLVLANVGDSRGILFRTRKVGRSMSQQLVLASTDHRPADANERQRIEGCGGRVKPSRVVGYRVYPKEGDFTVEEASQKQLGLAMSRSLGHLILSRYGVSPEPEFFTADLEDGDKLVLACDGIWDVLSTEDVMHLVNLYAGQDPQQACRALVTEAERRWKKKGSRADNMTAVIVFFNRCV